MAQIVSDAFKKKLDEIVSSFELKVYIQDNNGKWIDFSSRVDNVGKNSLLKLGKISHTSEKGLYGFHTSTQSLVLDNSDGFWNKPFENLKTIDGSNASFTTSDKGQRSIVYRHKVKLALQLLLHDGSIEEGTLGIFLINGTIWNSDGTVILKLMGLAKPLMERDASKVKDGRSWYINKSIWFLVRELLRTEFADSTGELPKDFILPDVVEIDTANGERALSHYGRPPEWDGTNWRNDGFITRAICCAQASGDSKKYLYLGCDNELWKWDPATDTYTKCGEVTANYHIRRLWFNSNDNYLWGVAYPDPSNTSRTVSMLIFVWNGSTLTIKNPTDPDGSLSMVFPGDTCYREGTWHSAAWARLAGQFVGYLSGENVVFPYHQYVRMINTLYSDPLIDNSVNGIWGTTVATALVVPVNVGSKTYGVAKAYTATSMDQGDMGFRFTLNQQGAIAFDSNQNVIIYAIKFYASPYDYRLYKYNISTNTLSQIANYPNGDYQPIAIDCNNVGYAFIGMMEWKDTGTDQSVPKYYRLALSTSSWLDRSSHIPDSYLATLEIYAPPGVDNPYFVCLDREIMDYKLYQDGVSLFSLKHSGRYQPKGLLSVSAENKIYFTIEGTGRLGYYETTSGNVGFEDDANCFVEEDTFLSAGLVLDDSDSNNRIIYGISAPYILPESQQSYPEGKYYLWKFSKKRSDRIELADFTNLTVWKALLLLAQVADYVMGFDVNGNFYFVKRSELESSATLELGQNIGDDRIVSVSTSSGEEEVYNFCQLTPSVVRLQDLKAEMKLIERPASYYSDGVNSLPFAPFTVDQKDLLTKRIKAICTQRGRIDDGKARFKYFAYDSVIEANFKSAVGATDVTLYLYSVYGGDDLPQGIHTGDFIVVTDPDTGADIVKPVTGVSASNNTVTIPSGGLGKAFNENDEVRFIRSNFIDSSYTCSGWSDEGVTYTTEASGTDDTVAVKSIQDLSVGTIVIIGTDERRITEIDPDASPDPTIKIDSNFSTSHAINSVVYAWWSPESAGKFYELGGSNVFVKFELPSGGADGTNWTKEFIEGDIISVVCPGLKLDKDDHSKVSAYAKDSAKKFGKRQYPTIDNRFIGRSLGKDICQRVVLTYKDPTFPIKVSSIFLPYVAFVKQDKKLTAVDVVDPVQFPFAAEFKVRCRVRRIDHDPINCRSEFTLKAVETY